ncbi:hypothetical protein VCHA53O466_50092 [Vibrio chagasii]|nr:hypothetical protein VCHA53O466_50092 [Vibrio chagasii]
MEIHCQWWCKLPSRNRVKLIAQNAITQLMELKSHEVDLVELGGTITA